MIDVVFLLIIFFMVATKFSELERNIELTLPEVAAPVALTAPPRDRVVNVFADGRLALDDERLSLADLTVRLTEARREYPNIGVVIRGDANCPFQHVASALGACQQADIPQLAVSVRLAGQQMPPR